MMGTLNVSGTIPQLRVVIQDLGDSIGPGFQTAHDCLAKVDRK